MLLTQKIGATSATVPLKIIITLATSDLNKEEAQLCCGKLK